jgi:hypothetical protein
MNQFTDAMLKVFEEQIFSVFHQLEGKCQHEVFGIY